MIYLDSAATSFLKPNSVKYAMVDAIESMSSPGRGAYSYAMKAADKVFECREKLSTLFNVANPENVIFTFNATHALNIAIRSIANKGDKVVVSGYEHNSVTRVLNHIGAEIEVAASPLFEPQAAIEAFNEKLDNAKLAVCNHVSNVFGYILPIKEIAKLCRQKGVPLIIDASQSAGVLPIDFDELGADYIAMPGHKGLFGPQGTGVLLCNAQTKPLMFGGTGSASAEQFMPDYLPDRLEAGTHNVPGIAGLCAGVQYVLDNGEENILKHEVRLCEYMAEILRNNKDFEVFSSDNGTQAGVLSVRHKNFDPETMCSMLGEKGVCARCGLHCSPLAHMTAHTSDTGTVRFSFSPFINHEQIEKACEEIENLINM